MTPRRRRLLLGGGVSSALFDGTNDYLTRGANLTGLSGGKEGTISIWIRVDAAGDSVLLFNDTATVRITRLGNKAKFLLYNSTAIVILDMSGVTSRTSADGWYHLLASWDLANAKAYIYLDDVSDATVGTLTNDTIDYTGANWAIGAETNGNSKLTGRLAELWFDPTYLDISVAQNRRLFVTPDIRPVKLGARGERPLGRHPLLYHRGPADQFHKNRGTGGNFTVNGALTSGGPVNG